MFSGTGPNEDIQWLKLMRLFKNRKSVSAHVCDGAGEEFITESDFHLEHQIGFSSLANCRGLPVACSTALRRILRLRLVSVERGAGIS